MIDYTLKKAAKDDMLLLYHWANDEDVRNHSFSSNFIEIEAHKAWFYNKLNSPQCDIFIYYMDTVPVGQIRLEYKENSACISYSIDKKYRGQGHGKKILELAEKKVLEERREIAYFYGEVKSDNIASRKVFDKLGYEGGCVIKYSKKIGGAYSRDQGPDF